MDHPHDRHDAGETGEEGEEDTDLSNDPVLSALDRDLSAVARRTDNRLFLFLGAALAASYLPKYVHAPAPAANLLSAAAIVCIIGGIVFTIRSVMSGKQKVAAKYGLVCRACGHRPRTSQIMLTAQLGQCASCNNELNVHKQ
jgi:hypothetical protein